MIKALFFDIDGTLVSFDTHAIPETTIEAGDLLIVCGQTPIVEQFAAQS